ncbi:MAG TPA: hypothetical protein VG844_17670 [Terracidiphilus sp.]|nr:hypothetical protein [Terracidiphilus sp.]
MELGFNDKKKLYLLFGLLVVIVGLAAFEVYNNFGGGTPNPAAHQPATTTARTTAPRSGGAAPHEAAKVASINLDPTLHLARLEASENVVYSGTGRNIFSAESAPVQQIEKPIASPRIQAPVVAAAPAVPHPPNIDLKYFGYTLSADKSLHAFLAHGEDVFMAKSGDVVDKRYKVLSIMPGAVQITDLGYNNTQTLPISSN